MSVDEVAPVFVSWEEKVISQERGNRIIHFYLKDEFGNSELAVRGTERSVRHMMYVVPPEFLEAYGSTGLINGNVLKWRARREVVDWLTFIVSQNHPHHAVQSPPWAQPRKGLSRAFWFLKDLLCLTGVQLDDSAEAAESLNLLADGVNANRRILPDKLISRKLKFQSSDIEWSGTAWFCAKQLKHYPGFWRNGTTIYVHSFVYIMAEEGNHYLGYLEDMYEDKKKQKKVKVRWFHHGQEVARVIPQLDLQEGEVFITPHVQVISAECVNGPATVLTPKHYEKYLAAAAPHTSLSEIHTCFRQFKNNKLKPFSLSKLRGYGNQSILSSLDSTFVSKRKTNGQKSHLEDDENFTQDDALKASKKRNRSSMSYPVLENGSSGLQNSAPMNDMTKGEPKYPSLKLKLSKKTMGIQVIEPKPQAPFKVNEKIEVLCQDSGIRGCWFRCKILKTSQKALKVQYEDLMDADDIALLEEWIPLPRVAAPDKLGMRCSGRLTIRPPPPGYTKGHTFEIGTAVDAWCGDGWWEGVITAVDVSGGGNLQVYSPGEKKFILAEKKDIRIARDWIDNKWVDISGKPDIRSYLSSNDSSCVGLWASSAVVEGSKSDSSGILERKSSPNARVEVADQKVEPKSSDLQEITDILQNMKKMTFDKVEVAQKVEPESSGLQATNDIKQNMKRMTLWKPLHAIHEDEDNKDSDSGFDGDTTTNVDDGMKLRNAFDEYKDHNSGSSSGGGSNGDDGTEEDSEETLVMEENFGCSEPKLDAAGAIQVT